MGDLERDTAVEGGDGRYTACVSRDWEIWGPNGGYIAAIALRAAGAHSRFDRPASLVGHFLGVAGFDTVDLEVTTLRAAKRAESLRVSMTQSGTPIFDAMVWTVGDVAGLEHDVTAMPEVPDPEGLAAVDELIADVPENERMYHRFWSNFEERPIGWLSRDEWEQRAPAHPRHGHWYRFRPEATFDDPFVDACRLVILADTLGWPAVCQLHLAPEYVAPSIDLSVAFHRLRPAEPWLFAQAIAESAANGLVGCESRVWARDGSLLAVGASQLLCRPATR